MSHATKPNARRKHPQGVQVNGKRVVPPKTPVGFPLTPHSSGKYCIVRLGRMRYYGRWLRRKGGEITIDPNAWQAAWDAFRLDEPDFAQGREPQRSDETALTIGKMCNAFLASKKMAVEVGELTPRTLREYRRTTDRLVSHFSPGRHVEDLRPEDFGALRSAIAKQYGPVRTGNEVQRIRTVFKFAYDNGHIDRPVRFGTQFRKPSKAVLRKHRATRGVKIFDADELRLILDALDGNEVDVADNDQQTTKVRIRRQPVLRAMVLLGLNAAFYASDCGALPIEAVDLERGWIDFARPKTGIPRQIPLWPETVSALREVLAVRPTPRNDSDAGLFFITQQRRRFVREGDNGCPIETIGPAFTKILKSLRLFKSRRGFSALRHTFRTVADGAKDQPAIGLVMGHADETIADYYRHGIEDSRLEDVVNHVHEWLFSKS